nr:unnamed protein product [Callosobruchus analis]
MPVRHIVIRYIQSVDSDISKSSRKTYNNGIPKDMLYNGQPITNPRDIFGAFAEYFGGMYIFPSLLGTLDTCATTSTGTTLSLPNVQEMDVLLALKEIKPKMTVGPDQIPASLLRGCLHALLYPLSIIYSLA